MNDHSETIGFVIGLALIAVVGSVVLGVIAGLTWRAASWVAG